MTMLLSELSPLSSYLFHITLTLPGRNPDPVEVNGKTPIDFTRIRIVLSEKLKDFSPDCFSVFHILVYPLLALPLL